MTDTYQCRQCGETKSDSEFVISGILDNPELAGKTLGQSQRRVRETRGEAPKVHHD